MGERVWGSWGVDWVVEEEEEEEQEEEEEEEEEEEKQYDVVDVVSYRWPLC